MGTLKIISYSGQPFEDRRQAGMLLARHLDALKGKQIVVLGIPRGGLIVASELARELVAELDIVLARKLRTPGHPELAMGSVAEDGKVFLNPVVVGELGIQFEQIEQEKTIQMQEMGRRAQLIRAVLPRAGIKDKIAIVTDDGVATGSTAQAALWAVKQENPSRLIAAFPVGSGETLYRLSEDVDDLLCLQAPPFFAAVGQFYSRFEQVEDEEILAILREEADRRKIVHKYE